MSDINLDVNVNLVDVLRGVSEDLEYRKIADEFLSKLKELKEQNVKIEKYIEVSVDVNKEDIFQKMDNSDLIEELEKYKYRIYSKGASIDFYEVDIPEKHRPGFKRILLELFNLPEFCGEKELLEEIRELYK